MFLYMHHTYIFSIYVDLHIGTSTCYFFADKLLRFPLEVIDFKNSSLDGYLY